MKRRLAVLFLVVLTIIAWLVLRQSKLISPRAPIVIQPTPTPTTNAQVLAQTSSNLSPALLFPAPSENIPVRPAAVDEETWKMVAYRQIILNENQPVKFMPALWIKTSSQWGETDIKTGSHRRHGICNNQFFCVESGKSDTGDLFRCFPIQMVGFNLLEPTGLFWT